MTHTPTRVDIKTAGWISGTDMPLPRQCQTATCIHKDHQLTGKLPESSWAPPSGYDKTALETAFREHDAYEAVEPANRGWAMPSHMMDITDRTHVETVQRKWWHFGAFSETKREVVCWDTECDKEHSLPAPLPLLDLPTVSVRRGGLRHWPMIPSFHAHAVKRGLRWEVRVSVAGQPYEVVARWWTRGYAVEHAKLLEKFHRDIRTRIEDHVIQHGW